ncbi:hypothetical protein I79_022684 [Cricetulus griseus]|uniref:Uncharacterized protein n=1 Tax=Cricetulus griseus TaxID=10029 RepID=G3IG07_CRIGR|nr:hypothetical protein I79_022684 [Cricetulus griseus]
MVCRIIWRLRVGKAVFCLYPGSRDTGHLCSTGVGRQGVGSVAVSNGLNSGSLYPAAHQ